MVPLQLAPEELYCQVSQPFGELGPEWLEGGYHQGGYHGEQFLGRVASRITS
jgi:hypothetical protein